MIFRSFFVLAIAAATGTGCSESSVASAAPSPITSDQLAGSWALASIEPVGQAAQAAPTGATYTATFADGRLSTRVDCNVCSGPFVLSGNVLTTGSGLACTRAACATMAFGHLYTSLLAGESTVTRNGDALELSSARGAVYFRRR